jgi:hypothetical protein
MVCIADLGLAIKTDDPRAKDEKCGTSYISKILATMGSLSISFASIFTILILKPNISSSGYIVLFSK